MVNAPIFKNLVRLDLLEAVSRDYLVQFLRPFEDYLEQRDVALDGVDLDDAWLRHLHEVLNTVDRAMPADLQQGLIDVADLVGDDGHEQIVQVAGERQLQLFRDGEELSTHDLAFKVYLEHRELFQVSHARVQTREVRRFVEFYAVTDAPLQGYMTNAKRGLLRKHLGPWFQARNRTDFCDVLVTETDDEVSFLVIHGRPPRSHGVIDGNGRSRLSYVPDKQDTLVFTKSTGRLAVNAQFPVEQDFYRRTMGRVFFGDEDHFQVRPVFSGAPLVEQGIAALSAEGVPGLDHVVLREIKVVTGDRMASRLRWSATDLGAMLEQPLGRTLLSMGEILYIKLYLSLTVRRRPLKVEVQPPSHLSYDRRVGADVVRDFLLARGFMRLPERGIRAATG